jgi:nitrogen fixation NifU-like protein
MPLYSKTIIEHFKKPRNVGEIKNPNGEGQAGNIICGDVMKIYLKIKKNKKGEEIIEDIKFKTLGCMVAIANTSLLTTMVKGKTIKQALEIRKEDLIKKLGKPLPATKIHCSLLALDALKEAIYDYYKRKNIEMPKELEKEHQRILKINQELEKRYIKYQNFEKEILK